MFNLFSYLPKHGDVFWGTSPILNDGGILKVLGYYLHKDSVTSYSPSIFSSNDEKENVNFSSEMKENVLILLCMEHKAEAMTFQLIMHY